MNTSSTRLIITGDLSPIRAFGAIIEQAPLAVYGDLLPVIRQADCRIVNLESPLAGTEFIVKSGAAFTGKPCHLPMLTDVPFQVATLANNHTFDTGVDGFLQTRELLKHAGIQYLGAGMTLHEAEAPLPLECKGRKITIFAMSEGEDMRGATPSQPGVAPWNPEGLCQRIKTQKSQHPDTTVIAILHCGLEYYPFPPMYVYDACEAIAAAGADLIVCHHVHVPQGMTYFGKTPVFFSLGNFVFYQENTLLYRKTGYMLDVEIAPDGTLTATPVPYRIESQGLRLLNAQEHEWFNALFKQLSEPVRSRNSAQEAWNACLAWYGIDGYIRELENITRTLKENPPKGAAMLRNRVNCMQHKMHWTDGTTRIADGAIQNANPELVQFVQDYFTANL